MAFVDCVLFGFPDGVIVDLRELFFGVLAALGGYALLVMLLLGFDWAVLDGGLLKISTPQIFPWYGKLAGVYVNTLDCFAGLLFGWVCLLGYWSD